MSSQRSRRSRLPQSPRSQDAPRPSQRSQEAASGFVDPNLHTVQDAKKQCMQTFEKAWDDCQTDDDQQTLKGAAEALMLQLVRGEFLLTESMLLLEDIEVNAAADDTDAELEAFEKAAEERRQEYLKELTPDKLKKHPDFVELTKLIKQKFKELRPRPRASTSRAARESQANDSLEILEDEAGNVKELIPIIDPISKQTLVDPVRNSICLHVYGKAQITALLLKNRLIKCPQMGCSNRVPIKIQNLIDDPELKEKVRLKVAEVQRKEAEAAERARKEKGNTTTELE